MATIRTEYAEGRIRERIAELRDDHDVMAGVTDGQPSRSVIVAEIEGLCFSLGLITGLDKDVLFDRLFIEGAAA
ncbi:MAG TPA: hypothetical protein VMW08_01000 [Acidimicrobiales bacterium]|nr:hypothetical protein [Acidimicrobiales bacterium]